MKYNIGDMIHVEAYDSEDNVFKHKAYGFILNIFCDVIKTYWTDQNEFEMDDDCQTIYSIEELDGMVKI